MSTDYYQYFYTNNYIYKLYGQILRFLLIVIKKKNSLSNNICQIIINKHFNEPVINKQINS